MTLLERFRAGDVRALARLISLVEDDPAAIEEILEALRAASAPATPIVGITGPPGAGKSTLVGALVREWRAAGARVAVLAVDPSSMRSGGAALGDRLRLADHQTDPGVYIRSMAARGQLGGLARAAEDAVTLLAAFGFDRVVVETVGVGQAEIDISRLAHVVVVVQAPGLGDEMQAIKAGILEVADVVAVNKADLPGATVLVAQLRALAASGEYSPAVVPVSASTGEGIVDLVRLIDAGVSRPRERAADARERLVGAALMEIREHLLATPALAELAEAVARGDLTVQTASRLLVGSFRDGC